MIKGNSCVRTVENSGKTDLAAPSPVDRVGTLDKTHPPPSAIKPGTAYLPPSPSWI